MQWLDLERLWAPGGLVVDADGDGLADGAAALLVLAARSGSRANAGALDVAARLGLECLALSLPVAAVDEGVSPADLAGRVPVLFGPRHAWLGQVQLPPGLPPLARLGPGCLVSGWLERAGYSGPALLVSGADDAGTLLAARFLAAQWPGVGGTGADPLCALAVAASGAVAAWRVGADGVARPAPVPGGGAAAPDAAAAGAEPPAAGAPAPDQWTTPPLTGLEQLFGPAGFLRRSGPHFPDRAGFSATINDAASPAEIAALADLAARVGVEACGVSFPLSRAPGEPSEAGGPAQVLRLAPPRPGQAPDEGVLTLNNGVLLVCGDAAGRIAALRALARHLPYFGAWQPGGPDLAWLVRDVSDALAGRPPRPEPAGAALPQGEVLLEREWRGEWEVERARRLWREAVLPRLAPGGGPVHVDLRLSEPAAVRAALAAELRAALAAAGCTPGEVRVRSAYKQGLHWLTEEVVPELAALPGVVRLELAAARFAEPGCLELPIRLLQECWPGDELLARALGWSATGPDAAGRIALRLVEPAQLPPAPAPPAGHPGGGGPLLVLTAFGADGAVLRRWGLRPTWSRRRYLETFPELGWVHPPTGWLRVMQDGHVLADEPLATDPELFWDHYQGEVLPALRTALSGGGAAPDPLAQPLFAALEIHVWLSEADERLGVREEQVSPLDALHEDLYFGTLEWFAAWGRAAAGAPYDAPGAVLPWVHAGTGAGPRSTVRLTALPAAVRPGPPVPAPRAGVKRLRVASDGALREATLAVRAASGGAVREAVRVALPPGAPPVVLEVDGVAIARLTPPAAPAAAPSPGETAAPDAAVIGPEQLPAHLARLAALPGVSVWQAGRSYAGRPIYAVAVQPPLPAAIRPLTKAAALKPSLLLAGRHHANEVSATSAQLLLLQRLAAAPDLTRRVLVVAVPLENVDGAATHHAMQAEHPTWKLHAARFNAAGLEFRKAYGAPDSPFTEARVLPDLWRATLPDVFLDDHGVPSHEWAQPFAGYNSPPCFQQSYWLPNAVLYGIFYDADLPPDGAAAVASRSLERAVVAAVDGDPELHALNARLRERYATWGHAFVPERFPLQTRGGMISYHVRRTGWLAGETAITPVTWVSEVPDETAQGEHLRLCTRAHLMADLAAVAWLADQPQPAVSRVFSDGGRTVRLRQRPRPLVVPAGMVNFAE